MVRWKQLGICLALWVIVGLSWVPWQSIKWRTVPNYKEISRFVILDYLLSDLHLFTSPCVNIKAKAKDVSMNSRGVSFLRRRRLYHVFNWFRTGTNFDYISFYESLSKTSEFYINILMFLIGLSYEFHTFLFTNGACWFRMYILCVGYNRGNGAHLRNGCA